MSVIYKITCIENSKYYIGSTVNKRQRWARHRKDLRENRHKNRNMQMSWNKYGEQSFVFEVIEEVSDPNMLMVVEQHYLDDCVGHTDGVNYNKFADSPWRGKFGPEAPMYGRITPQYVREKISASLSGQNHPNWGKPRSEETKAKITASNKAYPHNEYRHTPEAKLKIARAGMGRTQSQATRDKRRATMQGHEVSSITRAKISKTLSGEGNYWYGKKRPEHGAKVSKAVVTTDANGNRTEYASIAELRNALQLKPPTVNRALKSGKAITRGKCTGWVFKYLDQT